MNLRDIESSVWDELRKATGQMDGRRSAHFGAIARDIEEKKREWEARINACLDDRDPKSLSDSATGNESDGRRRRVPHRTSSDYTGRSVRGFEFDGTFVHANTYKTLLVHLANVLRKKHPGQFDSKVLSFGGRKRRYFSRNAADLKYAEELEGRDLYVETNLNANLAAAICFEMVSELGYDEAALTLHFAQ